MQSTMFMSKPKKEKNLELENHLKLVRSFVNVINVKLLMFPTSKVINSFYCDPPWGVPKVSILLVL